MATLKWLKSGGNYYYFDDAPVHASSITLNESSITLTEAGQTGQLTATVTPDDAVEKHVHWSSSDLTVAFVDQTGLVTCINPGSCTITAECDGVSATCNIIKGKIIDYLLIGGGGGGAGPGGGGAGGVIQKECELVQPGSYCIIIGAGGAGALTTGSQQGCNGGNSCFGEIIAYGGGGGGTTCNNTCNGNDGGSGGGGGNYDCYYGRGGYGCSGQGYNGGCANCCKTGGGGGGAGGVGGDYRSNYNGGHGGYGIQSCISGSTQDYAGGGGGYGNCPGSGRNGGGTAGYNGCPKGCNATTYGSGGGGTIYGYSFYGGGGAGCQGVFILRYLTSCGYNISGGCCYVCGDYTIHCFTSDGTLTVS